MSVGGLGSASGELLIDIAQAMANLQTLENRVKGLSDTGGDTFKGAEAGGTRLDNLQTKLDGVNRKYGELGKVGLGAGALVAAGFGLSINSAANFEQSMSNVSAALGSVGGDAGLTQEQFEALNDEALRIGASTSVSAGEAAAAMESLGKSGLNATQILEGGAAAVVSISEATGESIAQSADSFGSLTNLFKDTGISASEMADAIVVGMNNSNATLSEFQTGIARLAPVIAQTGMSFNDSAAAIAYFNSRGFSAAEVGTSLTRAFTDLADPIDGTGEAMAAMGIAAFDSKGEFVGFPAIMDQVAAATEGMTDEQRQAALATIFSADAIDLMADASKTGGDDLVALTEKTKEQGVAAKQAEERMDNFKGSLEKLRGAIGSLAIEIGTPFLGPLRAIAEAAASLVEKFIALPKPIRTAIAALVGLAGAFAGVAGAIVVFGPGVVKVISQMRNMAAAVTRLIPLLAGLSLPILLIVAALALLGAAYATNFLGFRDAVNSVASAVGEKLGTAARALMDFANSVKSAFDAFRSGGQNPVQAAFNAIGLELDALGARLGPFGAVLRTVASGFRFLGDFAGQFGANFGYFRKSVNPVAAVLKSLGATVTAMAKRFGPFESTVKAVGRAFTGFGKAAGDIGDILQAAVAGDWNEVLDETRSMIENLTDGYLSFVSAVASFPLNVISAGFGLISDAIGGLADRIGGPFGDALQGVSDAFGNLSDAAGNFADAIVSAFEGDFGGALDSVQEGLTNVGEAFLDLGGAAVDALGGAWDALSGVDWGGVLSGIGSALSDAGSAALDFGSTILNAIQDALPSLDELTTMAGNLASDLGSAISTAIETAADFAVNIGGKLLSEIQDALPTLGELAGMAGTFASDIGNAISTAIETATDFAVNIGSKLLAEIQDALPELGELAGMAATFAGNIGSAISTAIETAADFAVNIGSKILAEISDALPTLGELLSIAGTLAQNLGAAISEAITTAVNFAASISERILAEIEDAMPKVGELLGIAGELAGNLGSAIVQAVQSAVNFAADIGATLLAEFQDAMPDLGELGGLASTLAGNLSSAITTAIGGISWSSAFEPIASAFRTVWDGITSAIGSVGDFLGLGGDDGGPMADALEAEAVAQILTTAAADIAAASATITAAISAIVLSIDGLVTKMGLAGVEAGSQFNTGITTELESAKTSVTTAISDMQTAMGEFVAQSGAFGTAAGNAFASNIQPGLNNARSAVTTATGTMRGALQTFVGDAGRAGQEAGQGFQRGIESGMRNAVSAAQNGRGQIIAAMTLPDMFGEGLAAGSGLGEGIAAGIRAQIGNVQDAASAIVAAASAAMDAIAQFGSPSKLTTKFGRWMAEGLQIGIEKGTPAVASAFADMIPYPDKIALQQFGNMGAPSVGAVQHVTVLALKSEDWIEMVQAAETGRDFANEFPYAMGGRR